eukprot:353435-Chlamydomonas_euryale.AAC.15
MFSVGAEEGGQGACEQVRMEVEVRARARARGVLHGRKREGGESAAGYGDLPDSKDEAWPGSETRRLREMGW